MGEILFGEDLIRDVQLLVFPNLLDVAPEGIFVPLDRHPVAPSFRSQWVVFRLVFSDENRGLLLVPGFDVRLAKDHLRRSGARVRCMPMSSPPCLRSVLR